MKVGRLEATKKDSETVRLRVFEDKKGFVPKQSIELDFDRKMLERSINQIRAIIGE